jgi:transposase
MNWGSSRAKSARLGRKKNCSDRCNFRATRHCQERSPARPNGLKTVRPFSRGGKSRADTQGCDHDFHPQASVTPYGIFLPQLDEVFLYLATSKVTSDFMVDRFEDWWNSNRERFAQIQTLLINQDNGPEHQSRRTQFMKRMVEFANTHKLNLRLAYYPPYHSKYNPIERVWGILENHWHGSILDEIETVVNFAQTMTWMGKPPVVTLVTSSTPVKVCFLVQKEMKKRS